MTDTLFKIAEGVGGFVRPASQNIKYDRIPTGILLLDIALNGGFKTSSMSVLAGEASSGKSTISLMVMAEMLRKYPKKQAVYIDLEGTYSEEWASYLGVDNDRVLLVDPENGEAASDLAATLIKEDSVAIIVLDSLAAMMGEAQKEKLASEHSIATQARLISSMFCKVNSNIVASRKRGHFPMFIAIAQYRTNVMQMFGDNRTLSGGKATQYMPSQIVEMKNKEYIPSTKKEGYATDTVLYNEHTFMIKKEKTGGTLKTGKFYTVRTPHKNMPKGYIDQFDGFIEYGKQFEVITGSPAALRIEGIPEVFKGYEPLKQYFIANPLKLREINKKILDKYLLANRLEAVTKPTKAEGKIEKKETK
jgi:recombination protein RecA